MSSVLFLWPEELQFGCRGLSHSESPAEDIFLPMEPSGVNKVKSTSSSQQERLSYWKDSYTTQIILILYFYSFSSFVHGLYHFDTKHFLHFHFFSFAVLYNLLPQNPYLPFWWLNHHILFFIIMRKPLEAHIEFTF